MKLSFEVSGQGHRAFDAQGGLGRMWQRFGEEMASLLDELNEALVASRANNAAKEELT